MTMTVTITHDDTTTTTVLNAPVALTLDRNGHLFDATNKEVVAIGCAISGADSAVVIGVTPDALNPNHVIIDMVKSSVIAPIPLLRAETGGVKWAINGTRGQDLELTAPTTIGGKREYELDSPSQPPLKLRITVERT